MKIKNREKLLTLLAAIGIGLLVADQLVVRPLTRLWKARASRIALLTRGLNNGQVLLDRERDPRTSLRVRWAYMNSNTLPVNVTVAENRVLKSVDRWIQASRISFTSIKPQWKQNAEDHWTLECRADAFGNAQAVARFLYELGADPLALKIEELDLTARDSEGQLLSLGVRFTGLLLTENKNETAR